MSSSKREGIRVSTYIRCRNALLVCGALITLSGCPVTSVFADTSDYTVGSDDQIAVTVFNHPELSVTARISKSGNITFPLLGVIPVAGSTTRGLEELLTRRLGEGGFVRQPQVSVAVSDYESQKVAVMGQVTKPGQYALTTSNKVLDLLAQAGGLVSGTTGGLATSLAGDEATLIRRDGTKIPIDLHALFEGDPRQNPAVFGGDTIFIPRAPLFYVYGQVQKPGSYKLERNMTVTQAISTGGGLTPKGSEHWMVVKRRDANGKIRELSVKGRDLLAPDDVLTIKESWF
jgi:polysaccharide export outer membrane protein